MIRGPNAPLPVCAQTWYAAPNATTVESLALRRYSEGVGGGLTAAASDRGRKQQHDIGGTRRTDRHQHAGYPVLAASSGWQYFPILA